MADFLCASLLQQGYISAAGNVAASTTGGNQSGVTLDRGKATTVISRHRHAAGTPLPGVDHRARNATP